MGRVASIKLDDVRNARAALIAVGKPHGIIAIRNQIGRGSPQLISKFLQELNDDTVAPLPKQPNPKELPEIHLAWQAVSEGIESLIHAKDSVNASVPDAEGSHIQPPAPPFNSPARLEKLEHLLDEQQAHLRRLEALNHKLEEQLMQQQDLFDSWRHEQHAERQLLKTQLDQLAEFITKKPVRRVRKKAEQLDLYRDSEN